jgi:hypothetical protein
VSPAAESPVDPWDEPPKPWERQPGETSKAFDAFATWRDLGPERSVQKAADALGKSRQQLADWGIKNNWRPRLNAWERELDRRSTEAQLKAVEEMAVRHTRGALLLFNAATQRAQQLSDDPTQLSPRDVARMFAVAVDVERKARGEPEKVAVDVTSTAVQSAVDQFLETLDRMGENLTAPTFSPIPGAGAGEPTGPVLGPDREGADE